MMLRHVPETISDLIREEWLILSLLLVWSLAGLTVICERVFSLWNVLPKSEAFKNQVITALEDDDFEKASAFGSPAPLAEAFHRALEVFRKKPKDTGVLTSTGRRGWDFKKYLWALGTVGSSAPFVGLFGTVVGILKAFQNIAAAGQVVSRSSPRALLALVATAADF